MRIGVGLMCGVYTVNRKYGTGKWDADVTVRDHCVGTGTPSPGHTVLILTLTPRHHQEVNGLPSKKINTNV